MFSKKNKTLQNIPPTQVNVVMRIYKALKRFADLQGPICYKDAQNTEMNLIVY